MARSHGEVVGFGGYQQIAGDAALKKKSIQNWIGWARYKSNEPRLLELMEEGVKPQQNCIPTSSHNAA